MGYSVAEPEFVEPFTCLTCGFGSTIDLADGSGGSEEAANQAHMRFDGAHRPVWTGGNGSGIDSPEERRGALGIETDA